MIAKSVNKMVSFHPFSPNCAVEGGFQSDRQHQATTSEAAGVRSDISESTQKSEAAVS